MKFCIICSCVISVYKTCDNNTNTLKCVISGSRCEFHENCVLLGYYAASSGNFLPTFRDNLSVPSSRVKNPNLYRNLHLNQCCQTLKQLPAHTSSFYLCCFLYFQCHVLINTLNTKRRLLYLKTQFVPRSKHFSSRL